MTDEGLHDPDKERLLTSSKESGPRKKLRPLRTLLSLILLFAVLGVIFLGFAVWVSRTDGFAELVSNSLSRSLDETVVVDKCALDWNGEFRLKNVTLPGEGAESQWTIERVRGKVTLGLNGLTVQRLRFEGVYGNIQEAEGGVREPAGALAAIGLDRWEPDERSAGLDGLLQIDPEEEPADEAPQVDGDERPAQVEGQKDVEERPSAQEGERELAQKEDKPRQSLLRVDWANIPVSVELKELYIHDAWGRPHVLFKDTSVNYSPGERKNTRLPPDPRIRIEGKYAFLTTNIPTLKLVVDAVKTEGFWSANVLEVETRMGALVNNLKTGKGTAPFAPVAADEVPTKTITVHVGDDLVYKTLIRGGDEVDSAAIQQAISDKLSP